MISRPIINVDDEGHIIIKPPALALRGQDHQDDGCTLITPKIGKPAAFHEFGWETKNC
jgi:hypothetical protein